MIFVAALALALWFGGALVGASRPARLAAIFALYLLVLTAQFAFPEGNPLRTATGGSRGIWLAIGAIVAVVALYGSGVVWLRRRAHGEDNSMTRTGQMSGTELERYARHIMLREIGGPGQKALHEARVLVVGAGGLGAPVLQYLAAAGVGTIGVVDDDVVDNSNLQRQVIHRDDAIGTPKVFSAQTAMQAQNPWVTVKPYHRRLDEESAEALFAEYDLVLDGTDNFTTRYLSNRVAAKIGKPLVSGALSQWEGQVSVFDPAHGTPCYECVFPEEPAPGLAPSCAEAGVIGPLPGVVGSIMAVEAIKLITGAGQPLKGEMLIYDALWGETRKIALKPRKDCPVCGGGTSG